MIEINCKCGHKIACEDNASKHKISALKSYYGKHVCLKCSSENTVAYPTKLKKMMARKGIALRALAKKSGIDFAYLSKLANGKRKVSGLSVVDILRIVTALDADIADVIDDNADSSRLTRDIEYFYNITTNKNLRSKVKKYARSLK